MKKNQLKKALIKGIPVGIGMAALYILMRILLKGGAITDHLFSPYGILTMAAMPLGWIIIFFNREQEKAEAKA